MSNDETVYSIHLAKSDKSWNIAKFSTRVDISNFSKPVRMFKAPPSNEEPVSNNLNLPVPPPSARKEKENVQAHGYVLNKYKKRYDNRPVNPKTIPWRLEDSTKKNSYQGTIEGNQASSSYYLFMFQSDGTIKAVPCADWYSFKPRKELTSLTTEEAELAMKQKNLDWDILTRISKRAAEQEATGKKAGSGSTASSGAGATISMEEIDEEDEDLRKTLGEDRTKYKQYGVIQTVASNASKKKAMMKRRGGEEGEEGDAPDFESRFDDDDDDYNLDDFEVEDNNPEIEQEDDAGDLTKAGQELKNLIKKQDKEDSDESDSDDPKSKSGNDEDEEDEDDDDEFVSKMKLSMASKMKVDGNGTPSSKTSSSPSNSNPPSPGSNSSRTSSSDAKKKKKEERKSKKNKASDSIDNRDTKKAKKESNGTSTTTTTTTTSTSSAENPPFNEEEVKKILQKKQKMKSKDLIKYFAHALKDPEVKQTFVPLIHNIASIVEENGEKYIILK